jgi:outer membrane receptor for monomeric catechols
LINIAIVAVIAVVWWAVPVRAQTSEPSVPIQTPAAVPTPTPEGTLTPTPPQLEAVTVTARRPPNERIVVRRSTGGALFGEADLKEVPFSVNIIGEAEIRNRQATNLSSALATDPAIGKEYVDNGAATYERLTIRGFTQGDLVINGQLTGLDAGTVSSANVDRLEVLRGPAAFRYGFVAPGGHYQHCHQAAHHAAAGLCQPGRDRRRACHRAGGLQRPLRCADTLWLPRQRTSR